MRQKELDSLGFPNCVAYEDGTVVDKTKGAVYAPPRFKTLTLPTNDGGVRTVVRSKLIKQCFLAPWENGIQCVRLTKLGYSRYYATADGRIFGIRNMNYITPHTTPDGYFYVAIKNDMNRTDPWRVHRLIALAFIPNPENKDTVDHINNNKQDNRVENLRWMWMWENLAHRRATNINGVTDEKVKEICRYLEQGLTQTQAASKAAVGRHVVKDIMYGSYYRISRDFKIPRYKTQPRGPREFKGPHGQSTRTHVLPVAISSTTSP